MTTTNFDTFCVSPDYVMPNSWKDSQHISDDSYSFNKILLCLHESLVHQGFLYPPMSGQVSEESRLLGLRSNPSVAKDVTQVETQQNLVALIQLATVVIRHMPGIFPRIWHDIIRRYTKCVEVGGGDIEHVLVVISQNIWRSRAERPSAPATTSRSNLSSWQHWRAVDVGWQRRRRRTRWIRLDTDTRRLVLQLTYLRLWQST